MGKVLTRAMVGSVGVAGLLGLSAPASFASTVATPSSHLTSSTVAQPTETGPVMLSHSGPRVSSPPAGVQATDTVDEYCPDNSPGAYCTIEWQVSAGQGTSTFYYIDTNGYLESLPPHESYCPYTTCTFGNSGQGAGDIPELWQITGNNVSVIFINDQPPPW